MTAAFLLMSSAALAGADVAPPPAPPGPPPAVVHSGAGCTNCTTPAPAPCGCETTKHKVGLFDKLKGKFGKKSSDCGCAPVPACAPVAPPPPPSCDTCSPCGHGHAKPNLFDKLKSWGGHKKASSCGPVCDTCGAAHLTPGCATPGTTTVPPPPTTGTNPPKEMPKPPTDKPKVNSTIPVPLPPVSGAGGLTGSGNPY